MEEVKTPSVQLLPWRPRPPAVGVDCWKPVARWFSRPSNGGGVHGKEELFVQVFPHSDVPLPCIRNFSARPDPVDGWLNQSFNIQARIPSSSCVLLSHLPIFLQAFGPMGESAKGSHSTPLSAVTARSIFPAAGRHAGLRLSRRLRIISEIWHKSWRFFFLCRPPWSGEQLRCPLMRRDACHASGQC